MAVTAITPAGSLERNLALTIRVCSALSGGPRHVDSTDHSGARIAGHGREPSPTPLRAFARVPVLDPPPPPSPPPIAFFIRLATRPHATHHQTKCQRGREDDDTEDNNNTTKGVQQSSADHRVTAALQD